MKKNMGAADRAIRAAIGIAIIVLFAVVEISGTAAVILGILAFLLIATGISGVCPAYLPFGFSTKKEV